MTTYKVIAATGFDEHAEGEQFEADLDADLEARALERGQLEIVKGKPKKEGKADE